MILARTLCLALLGGSFLSLPAQAQDKWPSKPIT